MRVDEFEIEGPSDELPWSGKEKAAYGKRSLANILEEVENKHASTYNRIPVEYREPATELPWEDPTPYELFSIFITPHILDQVALFTNIKADRW